METENTIKIERPAISFFERVKYYISIYIGIISFMGLLFAFKHSGKDFLAGFLFMSLIFGLFISYKIYKTKLYLIDFYSDSQKVKIRYLNCSEEQTILTTIDKIEIKLKNTTSREGFNCQLEIIIENKKFIVNDDFDWNISVMKTLFEYIKSHKQEALTEKEKFIISRIDEKLKRNPF